MWENGNEAPFSLSTWRHFHPCWTNSHHTVRDTASGASRPPLELRRLIGALQIRRACPVGGDGPADEKRFDLFSSRHVAAQQGLDVRAVLQQCLWCLALRELVVFQAKMMYWCRDTVRFFLRVCCCTSSLDWAAFRLEWRSQIVWGGIMLQGPMTTFSLHCLFCHFSI